MQTVLRVHKLVDIVEKKVKREDLSTAQAVEEYDMKEAKAIRMIGTSLSTPHVHQNKANATVRDHTRQRLLTKPWNKRLQANEDVNLHLAKVFNLRTGLADLQHDISD
ncbi:hypothetical protein PybrP1_004171 [[Pythium] brassicae (nom. inval.)]|nr:hypothetical protein PybrP1_004171 [[Pythium] brassicae (nom. inval.)]